MTALADVVVVAGVAPSSEMESRLIGAWRSTAQSLQSTWLARWPSAMSWVFLCH